MLYAFQILVWIKWKIQVTLKVYVRSVEDSSEIQTHKSTDMYHLSEVVNWLSLIIQPTGVP